jgi:HK97 family phage major capsid protein
MKNFEQEHMEALTALRQGVSVEMEAKINKLLDEQEIKNQNKLKEINEKLKKAEEIESKFNSLEADLKRNLSREDYQEKSLELKNFEKFATLPVSRLNHDNTFEAKYLRTDSNSEGGYLVPDVLMSMIYKKITEISNIRSIAKVINIPNKSNDIIQRTTILSSGMVGEGEQDTISNSFYGKDKLVPQKMQVTQEVTQEALDYSGFDLVKEMFADASEEFSRLEGAQFTNGTGAGNQLEGFMTNPTITSINSGSATLLQPDNLIDAFGSLKIGYNPTYVFNRTTLAAIRKFKDTTNQYLWQPGSLSAGIPNQLNGFNYILSPDMPNIGAGTFPVIFGDFSKGYLIGDSKALRVIRDDYTGKRNGKVQFTFIRSIGGIVTMPEAFVKIRIST